MFSSRVPRLIGAALMDLAEAMLRPVDHEAAAASDRDWLTEPLFELEPTQEQTYPHRRPARIERRRRPGTVDRATQPCSSPLPQRHPALRAGERTAR
ncbi:hypothetical protein [Conexibacter sp. CPCC 206217]|uniref:hypothetical protein n=1 Tax=Conexibacter sp. CPCC 206217 TaxID=3064574 RepID=UPI00271C6EB5|nr:hypothetical protein [Conexibacter sp. CPCC 206217]MDO8210403.1 hypothetical protein [Conexibacter sp. CPCC 206217]